MLGLSTPASNPVAIDFICSRISRAGTGSRGGSEVDLQRDFFADVGHAGHVGNRKVEVFPVDDRLSWPGSLRFKVYGEHVQKLLRRDLDRI
jgi:hypothetical protein